MNNQQNAPTVTPAPENKNFQENSQTGVKQNINTESADTGAKQTMEMVASRGFGTWLLDQKISLSFTTYQAGKIFTVGHNIEGQLTISEQSISRCMGLAVDKDARNIYMSGLYSIFRFTNIIPENPKSGSGITLKNDAVYVPQSTYTTGDIDVHDMVIMPNGELLFVSALYCCVAALSLTHSFVPVWKPKFVTKLIPEDRCHLNGLCLNEKGELAYASAVAETDMSGAWRDHRHNGGIIIDIASDEIVARGISMPHSPRLYQGKLYLHEAGTGYFGYVDLSTGKFEKIAFLPGFLRGLTFSGRYAIAGISKARKERNFKGLELDENLKKHKVEPRCGIYIIDLENGALVQNLLFEGFLEELYDVQVLNGIFRPALVGFMGENIRKMHSIGDNEDRLKF